MIQRAKKVDLNQADIVAALRRAGCTVELLHEVGKGCPDLLVGKGGRNYLVECKTEHGKLNPRQCEWHESWRGHVCVVTNTDEALKAVGAKR